ncbi:MAG: hypothetical protein NTV81_01135 [Candidatus Komeilibacteria bacterium]|nr:hypothetical protein [Candidatus Komeilibacteria bacterium]
MSKKIVWILIIVLVLIVLGLGGWWYWQKNQQLPFNLNQVIKTKPKGGIVDKATSTAPVALGLPEDKRTSEEVILDNLTRNFVERAGSYSLTNLAEAKQALAFFKVNSTLINKIIIPLSAPWQAVASRVLKLEVVKAEAGVKQYKVTVQRQYLAVDHEAVNYATMVVGLQRVGDNWQINQATWQ